MFTDKELASCKKMLEAPVSENPVIGYSPTKFRALLARLEAAEAYKESHPCKHKEPHGATDVLQMGCRFDVAWRKAAGRER